MDDLLLISRAQAGDHDAFTRLVARHQEMLYRLCYHITGDAERADELAHEAFVEAFLKLEQLRDPERFAPWIRAIALNLYRMALRREKAELVELDDSFSSRDDDDVDPLAMRVSRGLSHLSYPHRLVLVLHYLEGLSYEEIAIFLNVPIGTVMSRLHRGRNELKLQIARMTDEEVPMLPEEFTREVEAETALLLELSAQEKSAAERLSVLLARSPERFVQLIAEAHSDDTLANLAVLLRRLGRTAIEVSLNSALHGEQDERERAARLLALFVANLRQGARGGPALIKMPPFEVYLLLDALLRSTVDEGAKADLLIPWLEASTDEPTTALLINALLSHPDAALPRVLARYWQTPEPVEGRVNVTLLATLARTGTRFVAELLAPLASGETSRQQLALIGMEAFARSLHAPAPRESRSTAKWLPLSPEQVDEQITAEAVRLVGALHADPRSVIHNQALRVLGLLHATAYREQVEAMVRHEEASTRVAALRALADLGMAESIPVFIAVTEEGSSTERLIAVESLGRMQAAAALPAVMARLEDEDGQVRKAAINALGDLGGEEARTMLHRFTKTEEKELARTAMMTLATSPHFRRQPKDRRPHLRQLDQHVKGRLLGEEMAPSDFISLPAAIAALPEIRAYQERELTRYIARACADYSTTRRQLIMDKLMTREGGVYELTEIGKAVWRVERSVGDGNC